MTMQAQTQPQDTMSPEDVQDQAAATAEQADAFDSQAPPPPPREPHMEASKGRAARRKKARARAGRQDGDDFEGEDLDGEDGDSQDGDSQDGEGLDGGEGEDYEGADEGGDSQGQESKPAAGQPQDSKQELPEADLGGGKTDAFSDLANSAGAGLLGLQPTDDTDASADTGPDAPADTGLDAPADHVPADPGTAVEERPGRELFDEGPRPKKKSRLARKADEDPKDDREAAQVHESAQKLGKRSAEVRRQRRLAAPKLPTLAPPKPEPLRPPSGFDPPRLPGQRRRW